MASRSSPSGRGSNLLNRGAENNSLLFYLLKESTNEVGVDRHQQENDDHDEYPSI